MKRRFDWGTEVKQTTGHSRLLQAMLAVVCGCVVLSGCASSPASTKAAISAIGVDAAVLGGTPAAFTATYGHPSFLGQGYEYAAATGERVFLWLNEASIPDKGLRVVQLLLEPTNHQPWDAATAE